MIPLDLSHLYCGPNSRLVGGRSLGLGESFDRTLDTAQNQTGPAGQGFHLVFVTGGLTAAGPSQATT